MRLRLLLNLPLQCKDIKRNIALFMGVLFLCVGCQHQCCFEPQICYSAPPYFIDSLPQPFAPLTLAERATEWGKDYFLGRSFAKERDYYRALTYFKSALFLIPKCHERRMEIEYEIFFTYYVAGKYEDAVNAFESSRLFDVPETFPVVHDLLIALYDSYIKTDQPEKACRILGLIETYDPRTSNDLKIETAVMEADFPGIVNAASCSESNEVVSEFLTAYFTQSKSVTKARVLNAILPGAGYAYVGQTSSAVTSFLINALFIAAAYQLFDRGYIPAGIIVASLETGWYFGGINGAGIEANQYNETLYSRLGRETLSNERLFPILMIQKGF